MTSIILDLETNNKDYNKITKVWCISLCHLEDGSFFDGVKVTFSDENTPGTEKLSYIRDYFEGFNDKLTIIGHNIIAYDIPVLAKFIFKCSTKELFDRFNIIDTLVISRVLDPDLEGGHALADYAKRFGNAEDKVEYNDWINFNPIIIERCEKDVLLTERVYNHLQQKIKAQNVTTKLS